MPPPKGQKPITYKQLNGKIIKPVLYVGKFGKYMAGAIDGEILEEKNGRPIPYKQILGDKKIKVAYIL